MLKGWIKTNFTRLILILFFSVVLQVFSTISYYLVNPMLNAIIGNNFNLFIIIIISKFIIDQIANGSLSINNYLYDIQTQKFYHNLRKQNLKFYVTYPSNLSDMENDMNSNLEYLMIIILNNCLLLLMGFYM